MILNDQPIVNAEEAYAFTYDALNPLSPTCCRFVLSFANEATEILELGSGTGRFLVPIASAQKHVVGVELSLAMVKLAQQKIDVHGLDRNVRLHHGSYVTFSMDQKFELAFFSSNTFTFTSDVQERRATLEAVCSHLSRTGRLLIILENPAKYVRKMRYRRTREASPWPTITFRQSELRDIHLTSGTRSGPTVTTIQTPGKASAFLSHVTRGLILPSEIELLASITGFRIESCVGDYDFSPMTDHSSKCIMVLSRR